MNRQQPLSRREAFRAASAFGIGGAASGDRRHNRDCRAAALEARRRQDRQPPEPEGDHDPRRRRPHRLASDDVPVKVDGMPLKPFAGLGSWAAFTTAPHGAMVMGDTVVFQDEVTPADGRRLRRRAGGHRRCTTTSSTTSRRSTSCTSAARASRRSSPAAVKAVWDAIKKVRAESSPPTRLRRATSRRRGRSTPRRSRRSSGTRARPRTAW